MQIDNLIGSKGKESDLEQSIIDEAEKSLSKEKLFSGIQEDKDQQNKMRQNDTPAFGTPAND